MSIVSQLLKEGLKKQAKFAVKTVEEALPVVAKEAESPAIDQMAKVLTKKPAAKPKKPVEPPSLEAATPVPAPATQAPVDLLQQTGEVLPPAAPKKMGVDELYNELKPARPFPEEAYVKGKAALVDLFGAKYVENMIKTDPKDYANLLHIDAGYTLGLKVGKGLPPLPYEVADTAIVKYDDSGNPIPIGQIKKKTAGNVVPEQEVQYSGEYLTGVLDNNSLISASVSKRQNILSEIKDARNRSFDQLIKNPTMKGLDEEVIAVAQGDFRVKAKREVDPANEVDVKDFYDVAKSLQKKYDDLKERYKDRSPMRLFHGQSKGIEQIKEQGFKDPQKYTDTFHDELKVGGTSFTKDIGLGASSLKFGGKYAENYVYTDIPYASYEFARINMPTKDYATKDMNVIAQTITGSPKVVRPLSLDRNMYNETEDVFIESEKLKTKGKDGELALKPAYDVLKEPIREGGKGKLRTTVNRRQKMNDDRQLLSDYTNAVRDQDVPLKERRKMAYMSYDLIRTIATDMLGAAESVSLGKKGLGQTYQTDMSKFADQIASSKKIDYVIDTLRDMGAVQKADALEKTKKALKDLSHVTGIDKFGKQRGTHKEVIGTLNQTRESASKLAKGGFISRR
jgi:hypothetical protein